MSEKQETPRLIVVMGVSGSGKTTLAKKIAKKRLYHFIEADDFHSEASKAHMSAGKPLTDEMREPWIQRLLNVISEKYDSNCSVVLAYSGLKKPHRERFRQLPYNKNSMFLLLNGDRSLIKERMKKRKNHFMSELLLESQFDAMDDTIDEDDVRVLGIRCSHSTLFANAQAEIDAFFV